MKKLITINSTMLPLNMSNVDTDQIMPKQFLKRVERSGYGEFLFYDWKKEPKFPLNNEAYQGSKVLVKFADIFRLNSINIGLVPIETSQENVDALFAKIEATPSTNIVISIENKTVQCEEIAFSFELDDFSQKRILEGLDKIDITLGYIDQIDSFNKSRKKWMPKLA